MKKFIVFLNKKQNFLYMLYLLITILANIVLRVMIVVESNIFQKSSSEFRKEGKDKYATLNIIKTVYISLIILMWILMLPILILVWNKQIRSFLTMIIILPISALIQAVANSYTKRFFQRSYIRSFLIMILEMIKITTITGVISLLGTTGIFIIKTLIMFIFT